VKERIYLSIKGIKAPLYEYCRIYGVNVASVRHKAKDQGMPVSKIFCDEVKKKGFDISRKDVRTATAFDYEEYMNELRGIKYSSLMDRHGKRFDVEYFRPYGSAAGEWKVEKDINVSRLNEIISVGRNLIVTEHKR